MNQWADDARQRTSVYVISRIRTCVYLIGRTSVYLFRVYKEHKKTLIISIFYLDILRQYAIMILSKGSAKARTYKDVMSKADSRPTDNNKLLQNGTQKNIEKQD